MGIKVPEATTQFQAAPAGNHLARLYSVIDIGTQRGEYEGTPTVRRQVIFRWELPLETETFDGETKPLMVSRYYTLSMNEKSALRHDIENWIGRSLTVQEMKNFDPTDFLGKTCMVSVVHNDNGKAKVTSVAAVPKGMTVPPQYNPSFYFSMDEWDDNKFASLPKGFQKQIMASDEWAQLNEGKSPKSAPPPVQRTPVPGKRTADGIDEDDIPF